MNAVYANADIQTGKKQRNAKRYIKYQFLLRIQSIKNLRVNV